MEKFVEITRKDKGFDKENSWFDFCRKERIPFLTIKVRSKLASIQWDYSTYPPNMDDVLFSMHENIKKQASAIYDSHKAKNTWIGAGPGVISIGNLEVANAREVASELFDIIFQSARIAMESAPAKEKTP